MFDDCFKIVNLKEINFKNSLLISFLKHSRQGHLEEAFNDVTNDLKGLCEASGIGSCQG